MSEPIVGGGSSISHLQQERVEQRQRVQQDQPQVTDGAPSGEGTSGVRNRFSASQIRESLLGGGSPARYSGTHTLNDDMADVQVARVTVKDHGDIIENAFNYLANISIGIPSYSPCWETGGVLDNQSPVALFKRAGDAAGGLRACLEGAMTPGRQLGALGRCLTMEVEYERIPPRAPASTPPAPTFVQPLSPVHLPDAIPDRWDLNLSGNFSPDSGRMQGRMPDEFLSNMAAVVSQQASGRMEPMTYESHSFGSVTDGPNGVVSTTNRVNSYEAADPGKNNAAATKERLKAHRQVTGQVTRGQDGKFHMSFQATADVVKSRQDVDHQKQPGLGIVQRFTHMQGATVGGQPTQINGDDLLTAQRAYSGMVQTQFTAFMIAAQGDPRLPAGQRQPFVSPEAAQRFTAIQRDVQAGKMTMTQAVRQLEQMPEFARFGGQMPTSFQLERIMPDGSKAPITDASGQPVTVSRQDMDTILDSNTIRNAPGNDPSTSLTSAPVQGGVEVAQLTTALNGGGGANSPNAMTISGQSQPVQLGAPLPQPAAAATSEPADATVNQVVAQTNDETDAQAIGDSAATVDQSLSQVQDLLQQAGLRNIPADQQRQIADALQAYLDVKNARAAREFATALRHIAGQGQMSSQQRQELTAFTEALGARTNTSARLHTVIEQLPPDLAMAANQRLATPSTPAPASTVSGSSHGSTTVRQTSASGQDPHQVGGAGRIVQSAVEAYLMQARAPRTGSGDQARLTQAKQGLESTLASQTGRTAQQTLGTAVSQAIANRPAGQTPEQAVQQLLFPNAETDVRPPQVRVTVDGDRFTVQLADAGAEPVNLVSGTLPRGTTTVAHHEDHEHSADVSHDDLGSLVADASDVIHNPTGMFGDRFDQTFG
jgi:hypothetical protein